MLAAGPLAARVALWILDSLPQPHALGIARGTYTLTTCQAAVTPSHDGLGEKGAACGRASAGPPISGGAWRAFRSRGKNRWSLLVCAIDALTGFKILSRQARGETPLPFQARETQLFCKEDRQSEVNVWLVMNRASRTESCVKE